MSLKFLIPLLLAVWSIDGGQAEYLLKSTTLYQPTQVHLSVNEDFSEYVVTWSTWNDTESIVEHGPDLTTIDANATGSSTLFVDGGSEHRAQYIHKVVLANLQDGHKYFYHVGSDKGWSAKFWFRVPERSSPDWKPTIAIYGDMGVVGAAALTALMQEAEAGTIDMAIHVGDFAYDMHSDNARTGDEFMAKIEPIAAYVPYMVVAGNHDDNYNFSNYRYRFNMPGDTENLYYSFDVGPVHFIVINTEFYYIAEYGYESPILGNHYDWLVNELQTVNADRENHPWVITLGHRPMFCSSINFQRECIRKECRVRVGMPETHEYPMEILMKDYNVDLLFWGHTHNYERFLPFFNYTVYNGTDDDPYYNPGAPVHIISGSGGSQKLQEPFQPSTDPWVGFHSLAYGYTRMTVHSATDLEIHQIAVNHEELDMDSFWLHSDYHDYEAARFYKNMPK